MPRRAQPWDGPALGREALRVVHLARSPCHAISGRGFSGSLPRPGVEEITGITLCAAGPCFRVFSLGRERHEVTGPYVKQERETRGDELFRDAPTVVAVEGLVVVRMEEVGGALGVLVVSHARKARAPQGQTPCIKTRRQDPPTTR